MELTLDREDLQPQHKNVGCNRVCYEHFKHSAQLAVNAVGCAMYYTYDRQRYNVVYPPKEP